MLLINIVASFCNALMIYCNVKQKVKILVKSMNVERFLIEFYCSLVNDTGVITVPPKYFIIIYLV